LPGRASAPKGLKNLAQGFNPGNRPMERFALKGREIAIFLTGVINAFDLEPFFSLGGYDSQGLKLLGLIDNLLSGTKHRSMV
jgi:hypothetical protein